MQISVFQAQAIMASPIFGMKLPAAVSYKFAKLGKLLAAELRTSEESRMALVEEHGGVLTEDKTHYTFPDDKETAFRAAVDELLKVTMEVGHHFPMALESLGAVELTPAELMQLEPLFDVPEPVKAEA